MFRHSGGHFTKYWGGGRNFIMYARGVFVNKTLSYANVSEHRSLDKMNKESQVVLFD
jgi:hypothetical protein